jgi:hypothetical protein
VSLRIRIQSAATGRESGDMEPTMRWIGTILMNYGRHIRVCVYGGRGDYKDLLLRLQRLVARPCTVLPPDHYATFSPCRIRPA